MRLCKGVEGIANGVKETVLHPVQTLQRLKNRLIQAIHDRINNTKAYFKNLALRPLRFIQATQNQLFAFYTRLKGIVPRFKIKLPFADRLQRWGATLSAQIQAYVANLRLKTVSRIPFSLPKWDLSPRHLDRMAKAALYKLYVRLAAWLEQKSAPFFLKATALKEALIRPYRAFEVAVEKRVLFIQNKLRRFMRPIRRFAHRRILRIRLFIGWVRVVARHSLKTLIDISN